jgi:hypothetical protein
MKRVFFTFLLLIAIPLMASHIVGGEFELLHISGNQYQLNIIMYFDKIHGNPLAKDPYDTVHVFRKSDKHEMAQFILPLISETPVGYTQPACSHGEIITSKLIYTDTITLSPDIYNDPQGYYVVWQRCCRNYTITNIYSENPATGGIAAGQTFYLEFPAVVQNGQPFINSSPHLFPPLNDYACPYRPYYVNFAGVDDDNDSLVYTMITPLNTVSADAYPPDSPGPYPPVTWRDPPFSLNNIIGGHPDLRISTDGLLTCTPTLQGLYVFAVKVEQYRNKIKIGESRRDFQMLVVDGCEPDQPPQIVGKKLTDAAFTYTDNMAVTFDNTVTDGNRCIQVQVSDPDSQLAAHNYTEPISIRVIPMNFKSSNLNEILPTVTRDTLHNGSTATFSICFPKCPFVPSGAYEIGIIAADNACSLPETDTLRVAVTVQPPANSPPHFTLPNPLPVTAVLNEGDQATWPFQVVDSDLDTLILSLVTDGFVLADAGMTFTVSTQQPGLITGQLHWDAYCNIYDFTKRTSFQVKIIVDDHKPCNFSDPVAAVFNLAVKLPGVADPVISTDLPSNLGLQRKVNESLSFNVTGTQADGDYIVLEDFGNNFKFSDHSMTFPKASGNGTAVSHFQWDITCTDVDLKKQSLFNLYFVVVDSTNKCKFHKADTVEVSVQVLPPDNSAPVLVIESLNDVSAVNDEVSITLGQAISLNLLGTDADLVPDKDSLKLNLIDAEGNVEPKGYVFANATGKGSVQAPFLWQPDCTIFQNGVYTNDYTFKFALTDNKCFNAKGDTVTLDVKIKDVDGSGGAFHPPNVITPNGDNCNDYFALEGLDDDTEAILHCGRDANADEEISLPKDNCTGKFQFIHIFNRWGKQVFESSQRKFRWYAQSQDAGVYYYLIEFGNKQFKGVVSVRP